MMQQERVFLRPLEASKNHTCMQFETLTSICTSKNTNLSIDKRELQHENTTEKISTLHLRLQQEAEKIRKWKIQTELDLNQKDKKIKESSLIIDSLRKGILDLQIQNEKLSTKLQEEIDNRKEIVERHDATREMCNILKDYAAKVEERIQKCEAEKTEMKYFEKNSMEQFEKLSEQFKNLEITAAEVCNKLRVEAQSEKQGKLDLEKNYESTLLKTESELHEVITTCKSQSHEIVSLTTQLEENKANLEQIQGDYVKIQDKLASFEDASLTIKEELQAKQSEIEALKDSFKQEIDHLNTEKANLHKTIELQKEEISSLMGKVQTVQDHIYTTEEELLCKSKVIEDLTVQVQIMTVQIKENEQELEKVKHSLTDAMEREMVTCEQIESLKTELITERENYRNEEWKVLEERNEKEDLIIKFNTLKKKSDRIKNELECSKQTEDLLVQQTSQMTEEISCLRKQISELEIKIKQQVEEANNLKTELLGVANLRKEYDKKNELLLELQEECKEIRNQLTTKNMIITDLENKLDKTKKALSEIKTEKDKSDKDHEVHVNELSNDVTNLQKLFEKTKLQMSDIEKNKAKTISSLEQQLSSLSAELNTKQSMLDENEKQLQNYVTKEADWIKQEEIQKSQYKKQLDSLSKRENKLQKQVEKIKEELEKLKDKERDNSRKNKDLDKERLKLLKLKDEMEEKCAYLESENKRLKTCEYEKTKKLEELPKENCIPNKQQFQIEKMEIETDKPRIQKDTDQSKQETTRIKSLKNHEEEESLSQYKNSPQKGKSAADVLNVKTSPSRKGVKEMPDSMPKKRKVVFNSDDEACQSDSSSDLMEIEMDGVGVHIKNQITKLISTPVKITNPMVIAKTPMKPVPRGPPMSRSPYKSVIKGGVEKAVHHIGCLPNTDTRPDNISARLRQRSPVWSSKHTDDMATESTEFFCQALQGTAPQYLEELVVPYQPTRSLRSESGAFLALPTTRGVTYGNRCFRKAAATLWNNLPVTIRKCKTLDTFKKKIKTNLFVSALPS
ncbi:hypothetical protein LSH36_220g06021 [Paralvinella palmiformis]|uniref:Synaptonemal complex protein 1 n=1 Tax=Paralvinella palmiformis TaxID=53620 RepID=A0AAD9JPF0_9ANNE|nr:hypothetical protein LSH36_220g06021 [Paralvinella palmiformis]